MVIGTDTNPAGPGPHEDPTRGRTGDPSAEHRLVEVDKLSETLKALGALGAKLEATPAVLTGRTGQEFAGELTRLATSLIGGYVALQIPVPREITEVAFRGNPFMLPEIKPGPGTLPIALEHAWFNGEIRPERSVVTGLQNHTLHYAGSVFGGIRINNGLIFRAEDHVARFRSSMETLGLKLKYTDEELIGAIKDLAQKNGVKDTYVRIVAFRDEAPLGVKSTAPVAVGIIMMPWKDYYDDKPLRIAETRKIPHESYFGQDMTKAKWAANYAFSRAALDGELRTDSKGKAKEADLIFLDTKGNVAECSGSNVFCVLADGTIVTPRRDNILAGWTRDTAITLLRDKGHTVIETDITPAMLLGSKGVFLCGTAAGVVPVREIAAQGADSYHQIGGGKVDPVIKDLQALYNRVIRGQEPKYSHWLTSISQ